MDCGFFDCNNENEGQDVEETWQTGESTPKVDSKTADLLEITYFMSRKKFFLASR